MLHGGKILMHPAPLDVWLYLQGSKPSPASDEGRRAWPSRPDCAGLGKSIDMSATKTAGCFLLLIAPGMVLAGVAAFFNARPVIGIILMGLGVWLFMQGRKGAREG